MRTRIGLLLVVPGLLFFSCQQNKPTDHLKVKKGMIKVSVFYPGGEGKTFDMNYYMNKHIPLIENLMGDSLKMSAVEKGIAGRDPNTPVPYLAAGHLYFETITAFQYSMKLHGDTLIRDIPNYTNIQPVILISEVLK